MPDPREDDWYDEIIPGAHMPMGHESEALDEWLEDYRQLREVDSQYLSTAVPQGFLPEDTPPEIQELVGELLVEIKGLRSTLRRRFYINVVLGLTSISLAIVTLELRFSVLSSLESLLG